MVDRPISLRALWGNADAQSECDITRRAWVSICRGGKLSRTVRGYYEGERFEVYWSIANRRVSLTSSQGGDCFKGSIEDLRVYDYAESRVIEPWPAGEAPELPPRPSDVFRDELVRRKHRSEVRAFIDKHATEIQREVHGSMLSSYEVVTWTIPGGSATWTGGRWGQQERLIVPELEARARILVAMGVNLEGSRTYQDLRDLGVN